MLPNAAGLNRIAWDLRTQGAVTFPGMIFWGASTNGPAAPPGRYTVRLTAGEKSWSTPITVVRNPYLGATNADLMAQYTFGRSVRDKVTEANQAIVNIRRVKAQLDDRLKKADDARLKTVGDTLRVHASGVEQDVYQVKNQSGQDPLNFPIKVNNRLANLLSMSERGDGRPTNNLPEIFGILNKELRQYTDRLDVVWKTDLKAVNAELSRLKLPPLDAACARAEGCQGVTP